MPAQTACINEFFQPGEGQQLNFSTSILTFAAHGGGVFMNPNERPFIPLIPVHLVAAEQVYSPLAVASGIAFPDIHLKLAQDCRLASQNNVTGLPANYTINADNDYAQYLYKRTNDDLIAMKARFMDLYNKTYQFWLNANAAWTATQYFEALRAYMMDIINTADRRLFIPSGFYDFPNASNFAVARAGLKALDANFDAIMCLELYV